MNEIRVDALSQADSDLLAHLRSISILVVVFGHVGGFWMFGQYSGLLLLFVPVFFFISGAVSYFSFVRCRTSGNYLTKRLTGLLVPYYLLCLLSLLVYALSERHLPVFSFQNVLSWMTIRPVKALTPFPIGQVWFLHTLFLITLMSPLYYSWLNRRRAYLILFSAMVTVLSAIQLRMDLHAYLTIGQHNFYKPLLHSLFFISGAVFFSRHLLRSKRMMAGAFLLSMATVALLLVLLHVSFDFSDHSFSPDLYYVAGAASLLSLLLMLQMPILRLCNSSAIIHATLEFMHKHTYSIFLLHSFSIFMYERIHAVSDSDKTIAYGLMKLLVVIAATCLLSVPFTSISNLMTRHIIKRASSLVNWV